MVFHPIFDHSMTGEQQEKGIGLALLSSLCYLSDQFVKGFLDFFCSSWTDYFDFLVHWEILLFEGLQKKFYFGTNIFTARVQYFMVIAWCLENSDQSPIRLNAF